MKGPGNLYFLQSGEGGPIKIGWTTGGVMTRVRQLQESSPYLLRWIGAKPAPITAERAAHLELRAYRVRGEWFHPVDPVLAFVAAAAPDWSIESYAREHYRLDLHERFRRFTRYRTANVEAISNFTLIRRWSLHRWLERFGVFDDEAAFDRLAAAMELAEAGLLPGAVPPYAGPLRRNARPSLVIATVAA